MDINVRVAPSLISHTVPTLVRRQKGVIELRGLLQPRVALLPRSPFPAFALFDYDQHKLAVRLAASANLISNAVCTCESKQQSGFEAPVGPNWARGGTLGAFSRVSQSADRRQKSSACMGPLQGGLPSPPTEHFVPISR